MQVKTVHNTLVDIENVGAERMLVVQRYVSAHGKSSTINTVDRVHN